MAKASRWLCLTGDEIDLIKGTLEARGDSDSLKLVEKIKKATKRIAVSSAKGKGRELQKWVCREISELTGIPYNQQDDDCLIHGREMGQAGVDIILRGAARELFPFSIECKSTEKLSLTTTILQARANTQDGTDWMIVHRNKAVREPIIILTWEAFARIYNGKRILFRGGKK